MSTTINEKLARVKHILDLATRVKTITDAQAEDIAALEQEIQDLVTTGGQPNVIEKILVNGTEQAVSEDKSVAITMPTKTSDLENDSNYKNGDEVAALIDAAIEALKIGDYAKASELTALAELVNVLIGSDTGKSVRAIANEELAAQLIPENAKESLNTLAELAAWFQSHPDDVGAMNAAITAIQNQLSGIDAGTGTVMKYIDDAISALSARVKAIEDDYLKGDDKTELQTAITDGDAATLQAAKDYVAEQTAADDEVTAKLDEIFGADAE